MSIDELLKKASQFEALAQSRKPTPFGVYTVLMKTIRGIAEHPSIIPQAIEQVWNNILNQIDWARIPPQQQQEIKRKIKIAQLKQEEANRRSMMEAEYELGKSLTIQNEKSK